MNEKTQSICPICLKTLSAMRIEKENGVYLTKTCPDHGYFESLIWRVQKPLKEALDWRQWALKKPLELKESPLGASSCPHLCENCDDHLQDACCVLIELTENCNQNCRYCFAQSEVGRGADLSLEEVAGIYDFLLEQTDDRPYNIQLSGGEPTMHKELEKIIEMGKEKGFPYIQLNTNGKCLGEDPDLAKSLKAAGLSSVFLQFDGIDDQIYQTIRGQALFDLKNKAIDHCRQAKLGVVLVVTVVPGVNDSHLGEIFNFALAQHPIVRGIHLQPVSYFGRFPNAPENRDRLTIPQLLNDLEGQSQGRLKLADFTPLETGHPRCSFHGNFQIDSNKKLKPIKPQGKCSCKKASIEEARDYIEKKWTLKDKKATKQDQVNDSFDRVLEKISEQSFSITAMAFQDQWNLDLERLKKCRVHIATREKKLIPFCAYNIIYRDQERKKDEKSCSNR